MALSLCAPVSFHHQKETDSSPTARTDLNKGTDNISNFSAIVVTELTVVDRDQPVCHSDSLTVQLSVREISDDLPDCQAALPLPLSPPLSDNDGSGPLVTDYLATYIEQRDESIRNKSHPDGGKESNLRRIRALSDLSISEPWPETVNQEPRERDLNSPLSDDGNNLITFENKEENMNISGAQIITPTLPSNRAIDLETTDSEKVIINPPSWSWTWGALPVKSKSKSSSDLTKFVDSGTGILGPGSPQSAKSALMAERELNESSDTYAIPVGNIQSVAVEGSCGSEVTSIGGINEKNKIGDSLQCTVSLSNENNSVILNVEAAESGNKLDTSLKPDVTERILLSETISTTASVLLSETCGDDKHDSQVVVENIISGNDVANASTSSSVDVKISHSVEQQESSIDVNQTAINFEPPSVNNTEDIKTEGIQSNPLKINVISDPTSNDMWRWETSPMENETAITVKDKDIPNVSSDIIDNINIQHNELNPVNNTVTETVVEGITSTDGGIDIIPEDGPQSVPQGDQNTIERDVDGDTDQELDTLSLHDIPLDEISPEPAGGDFYDSDAESYVSLDEGEARKKSYPRGKRKYRYRRVLVPSQEQLQSLELHDGENEVSFELQNQMTKSGYALSVPPLRTQLFVWPQDAKIVIIDIEGAITAVSKGGKGWGIGGFLSVPRTAVHNGVAKLLTNIHKNGYRILYIAQSTSTALGTKEHLAKVAAGSDIKLPPGPVFQSPDSLIRAFGAARTDLFKAAALRYRNILNSI